MKYSQIVSMPSAVSNWLEEQLEARGIDAVVYTRYILSLLHSDAVDVIYSDEDLHSFHLKKEVKKFGGSRKRFRSSSDWWQYVQTEAEKLKRSAAVECLMSASEQTCGIESLVDELCEKLNEINEINSDSHNVDPPTEKIDTEFKQVSPQELAKRYYAAFPPLDRNASASPSKLLYLIPKWIASSKKKMNSNRIKPQSSDTVMKTKCNTTGKRYGTFYNSRNNKKESMERQVDDNWNSFKKSRTDEAAVPKSNEILSMNEDANMYDDLPVDIQELLDDSQTPHEDNVDLMNLANMRDTGRRGFIPCGTNITSSIWTNEASGKKNLILFDDAYHPPVAPDAVLDFQFNSFTMKTKVDWDNFSYSREKERNAFVENANIWNSGGHSWYPDSICGEDDKVSNQYALSLLKLNHTKSSAFAENIPKNRCKQYTPFSKIIGSGICSDTKIKDFEKEKDDLLTSVHSHFRPINEKVDNSMQKQYADGTTFIVTNTWDKINYRRTESGSMYMENDFTMRKKYNEYNMKHELKNAEFIVKYLVCQNDKSCQTDDVDAEVEAINSERENKEQRRQLTEERRNNKKQTSTNCTCRTLATKTDYSLGNCPVHFKRPESSILSEAIWQLQSCDNCNNNSSLWNTNTDELKRDVEWEFGTVSKIWSGGVVCHACLGRPPSTLQHSKLREDVSQDGDQLLSDLSSIQKSYMQESIFPLTEFTYDISEFLVPKERKRRHSLMSTQTEDWSFASRLEEDCLIQMSTLPTLRSVTL